MLRLRYEKLGNARWISHLDMMHMLQRCFLRAGMSLRHTEGYHPHAFVSIALPLPVGQESVCELLEFALTGADIPPMEEIPARLNAAFPAGLRATECWESDRKIRELTLLRTRVTLEYDHGAPPAKTIAALFDRPELLVEKRTKKGPAMVDIRPLIHRLEVLPCEDGLALETVLSAQNPGLNPELLAAAIRTHLPDCAPDFARALRLENLDADEQIFR